MSTETAEDLHRGAPSGEPLLHADDLFAGYLPGINILQGCSLVLHPGELVGIIGPNGAGKSTLLKALFGLVNIREGALTLNGEDITNKRADVLVRKGVGFVPQTNNVFPSLTIEENLQMGVFQTPKQFAKRVDAVFDMFPELGKRRRQRAGALSGGERQMVAMGRALMPEPSVLLLDEPSAGLSPVRQDEAFLRTRRINRAGVSVVIVEQNARRCLQICDRAYVLDQGRNAYSGPGRELMNDPKVIELYLGTLAADVEAEDKAAADVAGAVAAEDRSAGIAPGEVDAEVGAVEVDTDNGVEVAQRAVLDDSDEPVVVDESDPTDAEHADPNPEKREEN